MKKVLLIISSLFLISGCSNEVKMYQRTIEALDTTINVKVYSNNKNTEKLLDEIDEKIKYYDKLFDVNNEYKDVVNLYYINEKLELKKEITVDRELMYLIQLAKIYNKDIYSGIFNMSGDKITKYSDDKINLNSVKVGYAIQIIGNIIQKAENCYMITTDNLIKVGFNYNYSFFYILTNDNDVIRISNKTVITKRKSNLSDDCNGNITLITDDSIYAEMYVNKLLNMSLREGLDFVNTLDEVEATWHCDNGNIYKTPGFAKYE